MRKEAATRILINARFFTRTSDSTGGISQLLMEKLRSILHPGACKKPQLIMPQYSPLASPGRSISIVLVHCPRVFKISCHLPGQFRDICVEGDDSAEIAVQDRPSAPL
jgi:hypothetical protein